MLTPAQRAILAGLADGGLRSLPLGGRQAVAALLAREGELVAALREACKAECVACPRRPVKVRVNEDHPCRRCPTWCHRQLAEGR